MDMMMQVSRKQDRIPSELLTRSACICFLLLLLGCAAYSHFVPFDKHGVPDRNNGYIYGNFLSEGDLDIWIRNRDTRKEYTLKGIAGQEGIYAIEVDPGLFSVVMVCSARQGCADYRSRPARTFRVTKGTAYYFGDYDEAKSATAAGIFIDNFDKTTRVFQGKYPHFSGITPVNGMKADSEEEESDEM